MRASLARWIGDADALRHLAYFGVNTEALDLAYIRQRADDYYISLVGELFERMRETTGPASDWARLGNAFSQFASGDRAAGFPAAAVSRAEALLFASAAFTVVGSPLRRT
jgi:helicase